MPISENLAVSFRVEDRASLGLMKLSYTMVMMRLREIEREVLDIGTDSPALVLEWVEAGLVAAEAEAKLMEMTLS